MKRTAKRKLIKPTVLFTVYDQRNSEGPVEFKRVSRETYKNIARIHNRRGGKMRTSTVIQPTGQVIKRLELIDCRDTQAKMEIGR